ncbi:protein ASYMMETRIC LEAVES 2-like [Impatiens glandulifera]|uniref:protein ASYMMETRIC LEAVES 2-like n=1 Tax=Impatiens glandulifera TaxID=253017 RepID=UPI001FB1952A|nr:protein ASYMMETRIC LEAVES 2-like [Impatiens glandulifera]
MSSSSSPCAACKFLRRKCTQECVFAPYFPPDNPQKFVNVHDVFGASKVSKLLGELHASQREETVNSLSYEAEFRLRDPVYGCVGLISLLQHRLSKLQHDLAIARGELAGYIGSSALFPNLSSHSHPNHLQQHSAGGPHMSHQHQLIGMQQPDGQLMVRDQQQHQQFYHQNASHHHQQQQQMLELQQFAGMQGYNGGSDVDVTKQVQMHDQPLLDLGNSHHHHDGVYQFQQQPELLLHQQSAPDHHQQQSAL